jgi:predicted metal-dependent peptidase
MTITAKKEKTGTITDPKIDALAREKLVVSRISMLLGQPFFGNIATRLELTNADDWCPTAATDGRKFYYNSEFINKLKDKEVVFLVGHELMHVIFDHIGRRGDHNPTLSNIAADYVVNDSCIEYRIGEKITTVPCLYDKKYHGWTYEEVYDDLYENAEKIDMDALADMLLDEHLDGKEEETDGDGKEGKGRPRLTAEERQQIRDEIKEAMFLLALNDTLMV